MTQRAQQRLAVLNALERGEIGMVDAAHLIGRSERQTRRLRREYRLRGPTALIHGNCGRPSPRRLPDPLRRRIVALAQTTYAGANYLHLHELLAERDALTIAYTSLVRLLKEVRVPSPRRRRAARHRARRARKPQEGMLVQLDGSHHPWLEERGPALVLHAALDDATGKLLGAWFDDEETTQGYLHVLQQMAAGCGLPLAAYSDRHGIFHRDPRSPQSVAEQLRGQRPLTQIGRVLHELGIEWIPASSPQAKGRIERLFGTMQDRLVTELRLAKIRTREAANGFLRRFAPRYNARFAKPPAQPGGAYRLWPPGLEAHTIFCFKYMRTVQLDNTVTLGPHCLQLLPGPGGRSYGKLKVEVHHRLNGRFAVWYHGQPLPFQLLDPLTAPLSQLSPRRRTPRPASQQQVPARPRKKGPRAPGWKPPADHPWRQLVQQAVRRKPLREAGVSFSLVK